MPFWSDLATALSISLYITYNLFNNQILVFPISYEIKTNIFFQPEFE